MASTVWRGHLAFGLVSFPVRLYRAARAEKVGFRRLYRPAAPEPPVLAERPAVVEPAPEPARRELKRKLEAPPPEPAPQTPPPEVFRTRNTITADREDRPVERDRLVKGYEYDKGQYVVVENEELDKLRPETSRQMEIVEFVRMREIDPIYLETSYYVVPDEVGERPYSLLYAAMRDTGFVGLAQLAMHNREHVVILRTGQAGMIAHTMFYPDEVRRTEEFRVGTSNLNPRELDLAKRLIETMIVPFEPGKFRDSYRERLQELIEAKIAGRQVTRTVAAAPTAPVIDIMQALQQSLNAVKKPAAPAEPPKKPKTRKAG